LPPYESGGSNSPILRLDEKEFPRRKMEENEWDRLRKEKQILWKGLRQKDGTSVAVVRRIKEQITKNIW